MSVEMRSRQPDRGDGQRKAMAKEIIKKDEAFGIIPILRRDDTYLFLLIQHHAGHWGFPKGHADPGESAVQAACRELVEETGISDYKLVDTISFTEQYTFMRDRQRFQKTVIYFPALVLSPAVTHQKEEIRAYTWANFETAIARLSFGGARRILTDVIEYLATSPL